MYIITFSLAAMIPALPLIREFRPAVQTLLGSVWLIARWLAFLVLGLSGFWHTRPRLLLGAAVAMLLALFMITVPIGFLDVSMLVAGQVLLGAATGLIYTASLYFGMVLSEGSTEHGGYHEALIGVGMMLGPGAGAVAQWIWPGSQAMAVAAVAGLLTLSVMSAGVVAVRLSRRAG
jgi:hypothetical protein